MLLLKQYPDYFLVDSSFAVLVAKLVDSMKINMTEDEVTLAVHQLDHLRSLSSSDDNRKVVNHLNGMLVHFIGESRLHHASTATTSPLPSTTSSSDCFGLAWIVVMAVINCLLSVAVSFFWLRCSKMAKKLKQLRDNLGLQSHESDDVFMTC